MKLLEVDVIPAPVVEAPPKARGFFLHPHLNVGGSPDGVVLRALTVISGVEIKCPFNPEIHAKYISGGYSALS